MPSKKKKTKNGWNPEVAGAVLFMRNGSVAFIVNEPEPLGWFYSEEFIARQLSSIVNGEFDLNASIKSYFDDELKKAGS